jgi:hypothetical protein
MFSGTIWKPPCWTSVGRVFPFEASWPTFRCWRPSPGFTWPYNVSQSPVSQKLWRWCNWPWPWLHCSQRWTWWNEGKNIATIVAQFLFINVTNCSIWVLHLRGKIHIPSWLNSCYYICQVYTVGGPREFKEWMLRNEDNVPRRWHWVEWRLLTAELMLLFFSHRKKQTSSHASVIGSK